MRAVDEVEPTGPEVAEVVPLAVRVARTALTLAASEGMTVGRALMLFRIPRRGSPVAGVPMRALPSWSVSAVESLIFCQFRLLTIHVA